MIIDSVPVLLCYDNDQGCYRLAKHAYGAWSKIAPAELIYKQMGEVLGESMWSAAQPHIELALAGKSVIYQDTLFHAASGGCPVQKLYIRPAGQDGRMLGAIGQRAEPHGELLADLGACFQAGQADTINDEIVSSAAAHEGAQGGAQDDGACPGGGGAPASVLRILVVDDNEDSADSLAMLLERRDYEVRVVYSGRAALRAAREFIPDIVLLDIGLPDMSGYEVARQLRQEPRLGHTVLIAQTGWSQEQDRQRSQAAGFDHHLVKPIDLQALHTLLRAGTQAPKKQ